MLIVPVVNMTMNILLLTTSLTIITVVLLVAFIFPTLALKVGVISNFTTLMNPVVTTVVTIQMLGWGSGSEQLHQITSEGDNIIFGTPAAYCGYSVDVYPLCSVSGYDYYSSALGRVGLRNPDFGQFPTSYSLCTYKVALTCGTHHVAWCTSYAPTEPDSPRCPKGWGYIGPGNRVTFSSGNYTEPITSRPLKTAPQYLGKTTTEGEIVHFGDPSSYCGYAFSCSTPYGGSQGDPSSYGLSTGLGQFRYYSSHSSPSRCPSYLVTGSGYWVAPCYSLRDDFECPKSWGDCSSACVILDPSSISSTGTYPITGFTGSEIILSNRGPNTYTTTGTGTVGVLGTPSAYCGLVFYASVTVHSDWRYRLMTDTSTGLGSCYHQYQLYQSAPVSPVAVCTIRDLTIDHGYYYSVACCYGGIALNRSCPRSWGSSSGSSPIPDLVHQVSNTSYDLTSFDGSSVPQYCLAGTYS